MTSIRIGRTRRDEQAHPSWWAVLRSTARVHRWDALIPIVTIAFVAVFAVAGYLLARSGGAV